MRRLPSLIVNLVLAVLAAGAGGWATYLVRGGATAKTAVSSSTRSVTVSRGTVTATVDADGTVDPASTATADFATSGTVTAIYAGVGDTVTKGQLLARVDPAAANRALALADANLDAAQDALTRAEDAGSDTSSAENEVTTAQLAVDAAQADVDGTKLTAPMAGTITAVSGTVGGSSGGSSGSSSAGGQASSGFMTIANLSSLEVSASFSESDATSLKAGQAATISWSALSDTSVTGKVLSVDPSGTTSSSVVTYGAVVSIAKLPTGARPGQSVTVTVTTGTATDAIMVNAAAVTVSGNKYTATVLKDDGTTEARTLSVGVKGDSAYQIKSGLAEGEKAVVKTSSNSSSTSNQQGQFGGSGFSGAGSGGGPGGGTGGGPP